MVRRCCGFLWDAKTHFNIFGNPASTAVLPAVQNDFLFNGQRKTTPLCHGNMFSSVIIKLFSGFISWSVFGPQDSQTFGYQPSHLWTGELHFGEEHTLGVYRGGIKNNNKLCFWGKFSFSRAVPPLRDIVEGRRSETSTLGCGALTPSKKTIV